MPGTKHLIGLALMVVPCFVLQDSVHLFWVLSLTTARAPPISPQAAWSWDDLHHIHFLMTLSLEPLRLAGGPGSLQS